jgi:hypothetical protein
MTNQILSKLVKNLLKEQEEDTTPEYQTLVDQLKAMLLSGAIDKEGLDNITHELHSARNKYKASKRSPESYKAAAEKGKATRAQSAIDVAAFMKKSATTDANTTAANKRRKNNNLLPLTTNDYGRKPDTKYYEYDYKENGGFSVYKLKDEWIRKPVAPETLAQYWGK